MGVLRHSLLPSYCPVTRLRKPDRLELSAKFIRGSHGKIHSLSFFKSSLRREHLYGFGVYIVLLKLFTRVFISILLGKKLCNVILRGNLQFFRWYLDGIFAEKDTYDV